MISFLKKLNLVTDNNNSNIVMTATNFNSNIAELIKLNGDSKIK